MRRGARTGRIVVYDLAERYPGAVSVFRICGDVFDFQSPPQVEGIVDLIVVLSERYARLARPVPSSRRCYGCACRWTSSASCRSGRSARGRGVRSFSGTTPTASRSCARRGSGMASRSPRSAQRTALRHRRCARERRHRRRKEPCSARRDGVRPCRLRLRHVRRRRVGDARDVRRDGGRPLRRPGDGPRDRSGGDGPTSPTTTARMGRSTAISSSSTTAPAITSSSSCAALVSPPQQRPAAPLRELARLTALQWSWERFAREAQHAQASLHERLLVAERVAEEWETTANAERERAEILQRAADWAVSLEADLKSIHASRAWRLAERYRRWRDRLLRAR